jgi:hypothetical protein
LKRYRDVEIKFDPVTLNRLQAFYQQQQVKELEARNIGKKNNVKKDTAHEKASRLIKLNVLLNK